MARKNRANLKALFQNGDLPDENAYSDFIDSNLNTVDTTAQSFASKVIAPSIAANTVSAQNIFASNLITSIISANNVVVSGNISAETVFASSVQHRNYYGELILKTGQDLDAYNSSTIVKIDVRTTSDPANPNVGFSAGTSGRLTYQGATSARFMVKYCLSTHLAAPSLPGQWSHYRLYKNSAQVSGALQAASDDGVRWKSITGTFIVSLDPGDFLEIHYDLSVTSVFTLGVGAFSIIAYPVSWA